MFSLYEFKLVFHLKRKPLLMLWKHANFLQFSFLPFCVVLFCAIILFLVFLFPCRCLVSSLLQPRRERCFSPLFLTVMLIWFLFLRTSHAALFRIQFADLLKGFLRLWGWRRIWTGRCLLHFWGWDCLLLCYSIPSPHFSARKALKHIFHSLSSIWGIFLSLHLIAPFRIQSNLHRHENRFNQIIHQDRSR